MRVGEWPLFADEEAGNPQGLESRSRQDSLLKQISILATGSCASGVCGAIAYTLYTDIERVPYDFKNLGIACLSAGSVGIALISLCYRRVRNTLTEN